MSKHRNIQRSEYPIGYIPPPKQTEADYNKRMKQYTNRFNNWAKFIARSVKHN